MVIRKRIGKSLGELVPECAPFYLEYGSALLQQVAARGDVIGGAIKAAEQAAREQAELAEEEDEEAPEDEEGEEEQEEGAETAPEKSDDVVEKDAEEKPEVESEQTEAAPEKTAEVAETAEEEQNGEEEEEEEEDNETPEPVEDASADLEVVWELLETARVIYSRDTSKAGGLGLARALKRLGDFRLENDDVSGAIDDYSKCIDLYEKHSDKSDRRLAAAHHALAIAFINDKNCEQALDHFIATKIVFARRVAALLGKDIPEPSPKSSEEVAGDWKELYKTVTDDMITKLASEQNGQQKSEDLKEFVEIIKELEDKITDVEENIKEMAATPETHGMEVVSSLIQEAMQQAAADAGLGGAGFGESKEAASSSTKDDEPVVNNLGTIVGQKRKTQVTDEDATEESAKKQKASS